METATKWTKEQIENKITAIICDKLGVPKIDVVPTANFTNDLGADSLDTVELIMELENVFGIKIPDEQAEKIKTVQEAMEYMVKELVK